ncbi:MAG: glycine cleavage T C-terminal barrel domain-containing protein, partial [Candidatus Acidiferrales bacterium]
VDISRTGYTGDLGYEIWMPWDEAPKVWDELAANGRQFDLHPTGMLALDVARIEAGLLLIEVDYTSSKKALIESQKYSPYEIGLGRMVNLEKEHFVGREALIEEHKCGAKRQFVGLDINWDEVEALYDKIGLAPQVQSTASRVAVPVYDAGGTHIGKATSTTWSPTLKKMIALASVGREHSTPGRKLKMEFTVEAVRHRVSVTVANLPFFNPARKMATPAA